MPTAADPATVGRRGFFQGAAKRQPLVKTREGGKSRKMESHLVRREPGDLPFNRAISPACTALPVQLPFTEVDMAANSFSTGKVLSVSDRLILGFSALLLGGFLVFGVGLANSATIHDTAHDVRHANGFPCH
jgi:cobalt transporter subunit CbtB